MTLQESPAFWKSWKQALAGSLSSSGALQESEITLTLAAIPHEGGDASTGPGGGHTLLQLSSSTTAATPQIDVTVTFEVHQDPKAPNQVGGNTAICGGDSAMRGERTRYHSVSVV